MKAKLTALIVGILVLSSISFVFAQTDGTSDETLLEEISCNEILEKIDSKVTSYKTKQPVHLATYVMLYVRVETASKQAQVLGYDTTEVDADLVELDILINEFESNFDTFITSLEKTKNYACDENKDASYALALLNAVDSLGDVKETASEIYELYDDEIRENLLGLEKVEINE